VRQERVVRRRVLAVVLPVLVLAAGTAGAVLAFAPARATAGCPAGYTCVRAKLLVQDPGSDTVHQFLVEDKTRSAMFAVNMFGAFSYGEPVCGTGLDLKPRVCINGAQGSYGGHAVLVLYDRGRPVTLTVAQVEQILHALPWLERAEKRRPSW
jgi:hypothetical protein